MISTDYKSSLKYLNYLFAYISSNVMKVLLNDKQLDAADFSNVDGVRADVNAFVAHATENHIKDLIPLGSIPDNANIAVANAAYFKGFWATKFVQKFTRKQNFYGETEQTVDMMQVSGRFKYGSFNVYNDLWSNS